MIKVIIADDHQIVVDGLASILMDEKYIEVVGVTTNGSEVLTLLKDNKVDIAILDIEMPGKSGVELSEIIVKDYPETEVLILSMYKNSDIVQRIISSGAKGYILKNRGSEELVKAIKYIHKGQSYIGQEITDVLIDALKESKKKETTPEIQLTKREKEVLSLISKGLSSNKISEKLFIATSTVDTHRRNLIDKIDVSNSKELIIYVLNNPNILS